MPVHPDCTPFLNKVTQVSSWIGICFVYLSGLCKLSGKLTTFSLQLELVVYALAMITEKLQHNVERTQAADIPAREYKMEWMCFTQCLGLAGENIVQSVKECGALTLAGSQVPTKSHSITPLLSWTRERKQNERLMGQDKDRERSLTNYHHVQNRLDLGKLV